MIKTLATFTIGIAVGVAYASHTVPADGNTVSATNAATPFSNMHAAIPSPVVAEAHAPTF